MSISVDFSRPPTDKERAKLRARLERLSRPESIGRIDNMYASMPGGLPPAGLVLRPGFSFREKDLDPDASDRRAPPRAMRPTATRLITSRGAALRFALTVLAVVQSVRTPGAKARLHDVLSDIVGSSNSLGWSDLVASDATDANRGGVFVRSRDKRARTVRSAIEAMEEAGIARFPDDPGDRDRFSNFVLLNERGRDDVGEAEEYRVPKKGESVFAMPHGFVSNGWIHVLEDTEIALLLMVACRRGGWDENGMLAVPADVRLTQYGIHRDAYSAARKTLEWLGLLTVEEVGRHEDGRAENVELRVHRFALAKDGFERLATSTAIEVLTSQVSRT